MSEQTKNSQSNIRLKAERLALAIYAVSEYFPLEEPMRWELRRAVLNLLQSSMSYTDPIARDLQPALKDIKDDIIKMMTYIDVLEISTLLSNINCSVLKSELSSFNQAVENFYEMHLADSLDLTHFKSLSKMDLLPKFETRQDYPRMPNIDAHIDSRTERPDRHSNNSNKLYLSDKFSLDRPVVGARSGRQNSIVDYVRRNGPSSIRDISAVVKGCSEKTIQRELSGMVDSGLLRREGERRWSRYLIV